VNGRATTLIVEDHPVFRQGLRQLIEKDAGFEVVGEADDGETAFELIQRIAADIAIIDISLPRLSGLDLARRLRERRSSTKIVILTMHKEEDVFNSAVNLDVRGYLLKDDAASDIVGCLRAVARGEYYFSPAISAYLLRRRNRAAKLATDQPSLDLLTTAERRILNLVAANKTSRQIGAELFISHRTVEAHRGSICSKLNLNGSHCLLQFAIEHRSAL